MSVGVPNLERMVFDVHYTGQGGLFMADPQDIMDKLQWLTDQETILTEVYQDGVLAPFKEFLIKDISLFPRLFHVSPNELTLHGKK